MDNSEVINILVDYFNANGWPNYLTYQKLINRCRISSDESEPDCKIVEIKRHRGILGEQYTKGLPMSCFEIYLMRYAVNVSTLEVNELSEKYEEYKINILGLVSSYLGSELFHLTIKPVDEIHYKIFEDVSKYSVIVSDLEEAKQFVLGFVGQNVEYFEENLNDYELQDDNSEKIIYRSSFEEFLKKALLEKIEYVWEKRDF